MGPTHPRLLTSPGEAPLAGPAFPDGAPASVRLDVLMKQYQIVTEDIRVLMTTNDRLIGLGFVVLGAGYTFGLEKGSSAVLIVLPFAAFALLFYTAFTYTNVLALAGYKQDLERRINAMVGQDLLLWESRIARLVYMPFATQMLALTYLVFLVLLIYLGAVSVAAYENEANDGWPYLLSFLATMVLFLCGLVIAFRRVGEAHDRAARLSLDM